MIQKITCKGCGTKYGNAITYCRECDGYIPQINSMYKAGCIIRGNKFINPFDLNVPR